MAGVAVPFAVLRSGGSVSDIGYVVAAGLVPTVAFLLLGGVLADRMPRQRVLVAANVVQGLAQTAFALLVLSGHALVWEMMALTAARGCAFGFYMPAAQGLLPQTVAADQLGSANALRQLALNGARIAGAALGGLVVAAVGPGWGLVADGASYAIAATLRAGMRFAALPAVARSGVLRELRHGWRTFTSRRWLWVISAQLALVNAIYVGAFGVLGPAIADRDLGGASTWGLVIAAQSAGAALGATIMLRYRPRRLLHAATLAVPLMALPLLALAAPLPVVAVHAGAVVAAAALAGAGSEIFEINWLTAIQEHIPSDLLSRVAAYDAVASYGLGPVGTMLAGPLAVAIGAAACLSGGGLVIIASAGVVLTVTEIRNLTRGARPASA